MDVTIMAYLRPTVNQTNGYRLADPRICPDAHRDPG